jgi:hypothetical protein
MSVPGLLAVSHLSARTLLQPLAEPLARFVEPAAPIAAQCIDE